MIDYFALALGHGLLVLAFIRLVMRDSLDIDPAITDLKEAAEEKKPDPRGKRPMKRSMERPVRTPDANAPPQSSEGSPQR